MNTVMLRTGILLLCNLILQPEGVRSLFNESIKIDLCTEIPECKCSRDKDAEDGTSLLVNCMRYGRHLLRKLPFDKITDLELLYGEGSPEQEAENTRFVLTNLRNYTKRLEKLKLTGSNIKKFALEWVPGTTRTLSITKSYVRKITYENCSREANRLRMVENLFLYDFPNKLNLTCLPNFVENLIISNAKSYGVIKWPSSLKRLKMSINANGDVPANFFDNMSPKLRVLWVSNSPVRDGTIPPLPDTKSIIYIAYQRSNISVIGRDTFYKFDNLSVLNLAGNRLESFDLLLPETLKKLHLYENLFASVPKGQWADLGLRFLDLHGNKLSSVPLELPSTLKELYLQYNSIEVCLPEAFLHLKELKSLDLSHNRLTTMPTGVSFGIERYNIEHNKLSHVPGPAAYTFCRPCFAFRFASNNWFCDANFFRMLLWIVQNADEGVLKSFNVNLPVLSPGSCTGISKEAFTLEYLENAGKYGDYMERPPFTNCTYDSQTMLNCTNINLHVYPNPPPNGLKKIIIEGNQNIEETPDFLFFQQTNLRWLLLQRNGLKRIPYGLPKSLKLIDLSDNNITELTERDVEAFRNLTNLVELLLHNNHLKIVYHSQLAALKALKWFGLENNDLVCDCSLQSFVYWYEKLIPWRSPNYLAKYATCRYPEKLEGRDIRGLRFIFVYELQCVPILCSWDEIEMSPFLNCSLSAQKEQELNSFFPIPEVADRKLPEIPKNTFWKVLILDGLKLKDGDIELKHLQRLRKVDLTNNLLTTFPVRGLPSSLEDIDLSDNRITQLPSVSEVQEHLPRLKMVDLRNNKITTLNSHEIGTIFEVSSFFMAGNPIACNCSLSALITWLKANASDARSETQGDLKDLRCYSPPELLDRKLIDISVQEFCKSLTIDIKIWIAAAIFVVTIALALLLYIQVSRRRRYREKIISGFQKLLQEEATYCVDVSDEPQEEETFRYEAFIATDENNSDGDFLDKLIQELEVARYQRLCVSSRDFAPGSDVAENIVECIRASKRVILILSKNFVISPWCQYEVQVALAELHQRQKKLLIPIMLEDLSKNENLCYSIKTFISLIPTIAAPKEKASKREWEKFWDSLEDLITN